jgi:hypothetical protein
LKNHPFFEGVNFEDIINQEPPKHDIVNPFESEDFGGLDMEW